MGGSCWWAMMGACGMLIDSCGSISSARTPSIASASSGAYLCTPPLYSEAMWRDSSWKLMLQSAPGAMICGSSTLVSMKLSLTPRLHGRFDLRQLTQTGIPSSHFRCRSRHVRQPVRTRLGLLADAPSAGGVAWSSTPSEPGIWSSRASLDVSSARRIRPLLSELSSGV